MNEKSFYSQDVLQSSVDNARTIYALSAGIACEGLRYELRYLASWIVIYLRKGLENNSFFRHNKKCFKQAMYLSGEILRCVSYAHESGYISTSRYRELEESYRWINARICQLEKEAVAHRWLGRIIKLYHGEKTKKGGLEYENNDRFSIDGSDGLVKFSRVRAKRIRHEERKEVPSSRV